ncbi:ATP-dependent protease subunit HslV [Ligilactobacillus agilis]|uniref:ATP-dependent protease subunit HslV n=1 Tax=Ligilactobacillus agilis TaxID=1601 RepID=UPI001F5A8E55|nr:ATP-dependent protease subunit HslV [Ligilactobacillus agilis]UNL43283.1 ATP-dependent protease subunit HslV [Ligilactobacillus agilis]UNL57716.1 ATP-dependent protease subunit HslV [Ligilactobacillus agilis]
MTVSFHATTICAVRNNGHCAMAGDGQVTMGEKVIMKNTAHKVRRIYNDQVVVGFAGSVADAFNLEERFEKKLNEYSGNLQRAAVELAQEWRSDQALQKLEALLIVMDKDTILLVSGSGEVIEPDDNVLAIGSGGNYALAAAKALTKHASDMSAIEIAKAAINIAGDIDIFTNHNVIAEEL